MSNSRRDKIITATAFFGLGLVLIVIISRWLGDQIIRSDIRSIMLVVGFALMLLGTIWKVALEMNDQDSSNSSDSSSD